MTAERKCQPAFEDLVAGSEWQVLDFRSNFENQRFPCLPLARWLARLPCGKRICLELLSSIYPCPGLRPRNLSSLKLLNLSRNAFEELPPSLFDGLNLTVIDLSHNHLLTLNASLFDLESLTTLDLRGNRLTDATRRDLARLKVELYVD